MLFTYLLRVLLVICSTQTALCQEQSITIANYDQPIKWHDKEDSVFRNIDQLRKQLFSSYDKYARPVVHHSIATNVTLGIGINHVDVDELLSVFSAHVLMKMQWQDDRLVWDPKDFGNLTVIRLPEHQVWQPDILLYNTASGSDIDRYGSSRVLVYNNGKVLWVPPADLHAFCELNLRHWPYDEQKCILKFGSWTYDGNSVNITTGLWNREEDILADRMITNGEWQVLSITNDTNVKYYNCCAEPYIDVTYNITIKRHSSLYYTAIVFPVIMVAILTQILFWLPPNAGEKILIAGMSTLLSSLMLLFLANKVPSLSDHMPFIVIVYGWSLGLSAIAVVISVFTIRLSRLSLSRNVPSWLSAVMNSCVGKVMGLNAGYTLRARKHTPLPDLDMRESDVSSDQESTISSDWFAVAMAIDRFTFIIYNIIFGILFMLIM